MRVHARAWASGAQHSWVRDALAGMFCPPAHHFPASTCGAACSATVYKARFRGETVAAKEVELGRSAAIQAMFVQEAERLHQLRHANIVGLMGVCLSGPTGVLLMVSGGWAGRVVQAHLAGRGCRHMDGHCQPCPASLQEYAAGRDLHSALGILKAGTNERLFGVSGLSALDSICS